jgi:lipopolysaccharide export system permease protein
MPAWKLDDIMVLFFDGRDNLIKRLDADSATLDKGRWLFAGATVNRPGSAPEAMPDASLSTDLTRRKIEDSFSSPDTVSFWKLPAFIRTMDQTGFDSTRLRINFQSLLSQPFLFAAMILLAASVSMRPPRQRGTLLLVIAGMFIGFATFFIATFLQALGASHQIPASLAAWSPAIVLLLLGSAAILSLEDG